MVQTPALGRLLDAMNAFHQPAWCEGTATAPGLAISGVKTADAAALVKSLTTKSEAAPFGHQGKTKKDKKVRSTLRVKTRGKTAIAGLDLAAIVERVEEGLGTGTHVEATLLDVLVYPVGGKFLRHKDTPRSPNQLGTLIVEVPVTHKGGVLALGDGRGAKEIDWSGAAKDPAKLRWVAMYGDVDHEIAEVKSGTRVTLVYTLALNGKPRTDATLAAHLDTIADAAIAIVGDEETFPKGGDVVIPCEHLIIAAADAEAPYDFDVLRGSDAMIASTLARCGFRLDVSEVLLPAEKKTDKFPDVGYFPTRLVAQVPEQVFADAGGMLSFTDDAGGDGEEGEEDLEIASIEKYVDNTRFIRWDNNAWLVRKGARAKHVYEGMYSATGYFGNEGDIGHLYQIAALIVKVPPFAKRSSGVKTSVAKKPTSKKPAAKKSTAKKSAAKKSTAKKTSKKSAAKK